MTNKGKKMTISVKETGRRINVKKGKKMIIKVKEKGGRVHGKQWKEEDNFIIGNMWMS